MLVYIFFSVLFCVVSLLIEFFLGWHISTGSSGGVYLEPSTNNVAEYNIFIELLHDAI
jgi:hypothetical protein